VNVRGVEIEVVRSDVREAHADMAVSAAAAGAKPDERSVRAACARALADAQAKGVASVALPALGAGPDGISLTASGKILVQEAIRIARLGSSSLRRILFCFPEGEGFEAFAGAVNGYVKHFLEVLIWGPFVTVDAIIEIPRGIVLVRRRNPPLGYALPGGFVDYGESLETAVRREAMEETGLALDDLAQFHTYSDPSRDPRFHTVTTVFTANAAGTPRAGDDAADIRVVTQREIDGLAFAFDHRRVLGDYLERRRR
jgi:8-oxo-dGTP diphosphatase